MPISKAHGGIHHRRMCYQQALECVPFWSNAGRRLLNWVFFLSISSPVTELKLTLLADIYNITITILKYTIFKWITEMLSVSGSSVTKSSPGKYEQRWWVQPSPEAPLTFFPMCLNKAVPSTQRQHAMMAKQLDERNMNPWLISWCKASCLSRLTRLLYVVRETSFYLSYYILGWLFFFLLYWSSLLHKDFL